ncbi:MAG: argininosuccinate synthase [Thermoanaerobaculia bacterium]|jgi:argininosuccinate synthase|nr:argininosuccinate synthase [Thermoanaerobaculia bacterium]
MTHFKKVALAYSGGLDTSIIIPWLKENYGCEVVAVAVDVGQAEETAGLAEKAYQTGACDFHLIDAREEFARDYLFPVLKAGAIYEKDYLLGTSTARPLIARKQVEIALATGCDALAHGCTGKGNDQVRFELAYQALAPELAVIAPWREWSIISREDAIDYASSRGIPVPVTKKDPYSRDRNLWHLSHEGGPLEDPSFEPEASMFKLSVDPIEAPNTPENVAITFAAGVPVAVNGQALTPAALVMKLNEIGGRHGVGRIDIVENRLVGIKSRGVYETPGGTLLVNAIKALESITLDRDSAHEKERIGTRYADLVYFGQWFSPLKEAFDAFVDALAAAVSGTVTLKLYKGNATVIGRTSPNSLYSEALASFNMTGYDARDAAGFIRVFGLPTRGRYRIEPRKSFDETNPGDEVTAARLRKAAG